MLSHSLNPKLNATRDNGPNMGALAAVILAALMVSSPSVLAEPSSGYIMTEVELGYDCRKLTGRMQVRILDLRDRTERGQTSSVSRGLQKAVTGIFGGTDHGKNPDAEYDREIARLAAYNRQLVAKDCRSFDLEDELKPKDVRVTPSPTVLPPSKAKTKAAKGP